MNLLSVTVSNLDVKNVLLSTQMIPVMISPPQNEPIENVASEHANDIPSPLD